MTLVVTHANGFLGCFTQDEDGTMRQRALIDTGEEPPTAKELAELGNVLAEQWGWMPQALAPTPTPAPTKALPTSDDSVKAVKDAARKERERKRKYDATDPPTGDRCRMIVDYLRDHPNSTAIEIVSGCGFSPDRDRVARWHHQFALLLKAKQIASQIRVIPNESARPKEYRLTPVDKAPVEEAGAHETG